MRFAWMAKLKSRLKAWIYFLILSKTNGRTQRNKYLGVGIALHHLKKEGKDFADNLHVARAKLVHEHLETFFVSVGWFKNLFLLIP